MDISFGNAFCPNPVMHFSRGANGQIPVFRERVLLSGGQEKSGVLEQFLKQLDWHPKKIIMIDDQISELEPINNFLASQHIDFFGYEYNFVKKVLLEKSIDNELGDFQINYLLKKHIWLTDEEAKEKMCCGYR